MVLTIFLSVVVCGAVSLMMISAVAFIQDEKMFSSAPKEAQELILPREKELFYGARPFGWTLLIFSILMILGALVIAIWDGLALEMDLHSGSFLQDLSSCLPFIRSMT